MSELEHVDEPEPESGSREAMGAALLLLSGTVFVAAGTVTGSALVYGQYVSPIFSSVIWPLTTLLAATVCTVAMMFGLLALIGTIGTIAWPTTGGRTEYFFAGLAGLAGASTAIVAFLSGHTQLLNLFGPALPMSITTLAAQIAIAGPVAMLSARLMHPDHQPESVRRYHDPRAPVPSSEQLRERTVPPVSVGGGYPSSPHVTQSKSDGASQTNETDAESSSQENLRSAQQTADDFQFRWESETDVYMSDVGGLDDLKREFRKDIIIPATSGREKAEALGIPLPNLLLYGPPGTGKTYLARALATELGLPFAQLSGSDVQSKWINESASKINQLFTEAKQIADREGGAVVFLDELDSVLKSRDSNSGHDEDQKVVNEFLAHLQETSEHNILFIGATNRMDALDEAGVRAGRIDKKIHIGKPDVDARKEIIRAQLQNRQHRLSKKEIQLLAQKSEGATAADLESLIVDAAREAAFVHDRDHIVWEDVLESLD